MKPKRRWLEFIAEKGLLLCASVTSITILLIVVFLFGEGAGIFQKNVVEEGFVLAVHKTNTVKSLSPEEIRKVFDQEITSWKELGGEDREIEIFYEDDIVEYYDEDELGEEYELVPEKISELIASRPGMIAFIPEEHVTENFEGRVLDEPNVSLKNLFCGIIWSPTTVPAAQLGMLPLILGTLLVSLVAILIAFPIGLSIAIYLAEIADMRLRNIVKPLVELLAGIPSVVYGFFGLVVMVPWIQRVFDIPSGETGFTGALLLALMALPTIITVAEDAMRTTPKAMKEASLAMGATHWQTIRKVIIPYSKSGIMAASVLGIGRAIGETMAVLMVTGNAAVMPRSIMQPVRTIPATIAAELGEAPNGGSHYQALFILGVILFIVTLAISVSIEFINTKKHSASV